MIGEGAEFFGKLTFLYFILRRVNRSLHSLDGLSLILIFMWAGLGTNITRNGIRGAWKPLFLLRDAIISGGFRLLGIQYMLFFFFDEAQFNPALKLRFLEFGQEMDRRGLKRSNKSS